jgi:hypothetical protein
LCIECLIFAGTVLVWIARAICTRTYDTLYDDLVLCDQVKPAYFRQIEDMCGRLYPANTSIDYFPANFVVQNDALYYIDYECNDYMEEWNFENWGIRYWSRTREFLEYEQSQISRRRNKQR